MIRFDAQYRVNGVRFELQTNVGIRGPQGAPGADGRSLEFVWDGTRLGIRQEGGSYQYVDLQGPAGQDGQPGSHGEKGDPGADGYTPQRGVDYWTAADQNAIVSQAVTQIQPDISELNDDLATKLPKSPANWGPWTADEQAAARERMGIPGNYELIADITLDEEIRVISINFEEYLREMYVVFSGTATGSGNSTINVIFNDDTTQIYASCCVGWMNTSKRYAHAHISLNQGMLRSESMAANSNNTWGNSTIYTNGGGLALLAETQKSIKAINLETLNDNNWLAGCKFTVYGVRA